MTRLSINLNKVALVRNARDLGIPDLAAAARACLAALRRPRALGVSRSA